MKSTFTKYLLLSIVLIVIGEVIKSALHVKELLHNSLTEQLTTEQIANYFELQEKWQWVSYIFAPIFILLKTLIISSIVYTSVFFLIKEKISFKSILNIILKAEFIFLLVPILKIIWLYFFQTSYTLEDIQTFYPLSALNIIGYEGLEPWLIYPLQILNLFELTYIIYLAYEIGKLTQTNSDKGFKIVINSYVPALLLWVVFVMFLTLSMS